MLVITVLAAQPRRGNEERPGGRDLLVQCSHRGVERFEPLLQQSMPGVEVQVAHLRLNVECRKPEDTMHRTGGNDLLNMSGAFFVRSTGSKAYNGDARALQ